MDKAYWVAIISLLGVLAANAVLAWSKWLDVKQKENDHKMGLRTIYLTNKLKAAESAIGKWTVILNYYSALNQYLRGMNPDAPLADEFSAPLEAQLAKLNDAMSGAFAEGTAFLLYFDVDESFWGDDVSDLLFEHFSKISFLMKELKTSATYLSQSPVSVEDKAAIVKEQDAMLEEMLATLKVIPEIVSVAKERLIVFVRNIRQQLAEYENI